VRRGKGRGVFELVVSQIPKVAWEVAGLLELETLSPAEIRNKGEIGVIASS